jgi:hypothetical protein
MDKILWATAVGGMRVANALGFILLVAFIGALLGFIDGHPALSAWLVLPIVAVLVFENLWITGRLRRQQGTARAGAAVSLGVAAILAWQLGTLASNGFAVAVFAVLAFLAIMAVTALARPVPAAEGFGA